MPRRSSFFDNFAEKASNFVSHAPFFAFCVMLIVMWLPSYFVVGSLDTWQLIINTITTIVTFLLVALLQNSQKQFENAVHAKLDAQTKALADLMEWTALWNHERLTGNAKTEVSKKLLLKAREFRKTVGLETDIGA